MIPNELQQVGPTIKRLRIALGLSHRELAARCNATKHSAIFEIERGGNWRGDTLSDISQALGINSVVLLKLAGIPDTTEDFDFPFVITITDSNGKSVRKEFRMNKIGEVIEN